MSVSLYLYPVHVPVQGTGYRVQVCDRQVGGQHEGKISFMLVCLPLKAKLPMKVGDEGKIAYEG